jgi:hypothetical protein
MTVLPGVPLVESLSSLSQVISPYRDAGVIGRVKSLMTIAGKNFSPSTKVLLEFLGAEEYGDWSSDKIMKTGDIDPVDAIMLMRTGLMDPEADDGGFFGRMMGFRPYPRLARPGEVGLPAPSYFPDPENVGVVYTFNDIPGGYSPPTTVMSKRAVTNYMYLKRTSSFAGLGTFGKDWTANLIKVGQAFSGTGDEPTLNGQIIPKPGRQLDLTLPEFAGVTSQVSMPLEDARRRAAVAGRRDELKALQVPKR